MPLRRPQPVARCSTRSTKNPSANAANGPLTRTRSGAGSAMLSSSQGSTEGTSLDHASRNMLRSPHGCRARNPRSSPAGARSVPVDERQLLLIDQRVSAQASRPTSRASAIDSMTWPKWSCFITRWASRLALSTSRPAPRRWTTPSMSPTSTTGGRIRHASRTARNTQPKIGFGTVIERGRASGRSSCLPSWSTPDSLSASCQRRC